MKGAHIRAEDRRRLGPTQTMASRKLLAATLLAAACLGASAFAPSVTLRAPLARGAAVGSTSGVARPRMGRSLVEGVPALGSLSMQVGEKHPMHGAIDKVVKENKIILFMKGNKDFPQCGFSNTAVQVLRACNAQFETINVLENENIRQGIKQYSNWPTIPQLFIDGEFIGGTDIMLEMYENGEMVELVERVMAE